METALELQKKIRENFTYAHEECLAEIAKITVMIEKEENQSNIDVMYSNINAMRNYCRFLYDAINVRID